MCSATLRGSERSASASWRRIGSGILLRKSCSKSIQGAWPSSNASISSIRAEGGLSPRSPIWRSQLALAPRVRPKVLVRRDLIASYLCSFGEAASSVPVEEAYDVGVFDLVFGDFAADDELGFCLLKPQLVRSLRLTELVSAIVCSKRMLWRLGSPLK